VIRRPVVYTLVLVSALGVLSSLHSSPAKASSASPSLISSTDDARADPGEEAWVPYAAAAGAALLIALGALMLKRQG
jgi:hypothetical protein